MISKNDFIIIEKEVVSAINELFDFVEKISHNYILFLADGEYHANFENSHLRLNPYTIDNRGDRYKDESRLKFFIRFMRTFYSFPENIELINDDEYQMTMELMIYSHVWESKPYLKQLFRLSELINAKPYPWVPIIPEMGKHDFIREIRDKFANKNLAISQVITKGFHTSLRNAFAHSDYHFNENRKMIELDNYKGKFWELREISYNEWSKRLLYTALLSYYFLNIKAIRRKSLSQDYGTNLFQIIQPITKSRFRLQNIYYTELMDSFSYYPHK